MGTKPAWLQERLEAALGPACGIEREVWLAPRPRLPHVVPLLSAGEVGALPFFKRRRPVRVRRDGVCAAAAVPGRSTPPRRTRGTLAPRDSRSSTREILVPTANRRSIHMRTRLALFTAALLFLGTRFASAQTRIVTGIVSDSVTTGVVTAGQVSVQGMPIAVAIRSDGAFSITVPDRAVVLTVRSIGFRSKSLDVPQSQNTVQFRLAKDLFRLEAVVVTGQATAVERQNLANAVGTVSADQLVATPTASVETALQGKITGADIAQNNGAPGGGNIVRMRGVTSVIGTFQPLYVVDGVIVSNAEIGRGTNLLTRAFTSQGIVPTVDNQDNAINRIADINPNDIENVEVLKGAAASAIYGSKASNGVILISTKRGRAGAPQFSLTQRLGASWLSNKYGTRCFTSAEEAQGVFGGSAGAQWTAAKGACHDFEDELYGGAAQAWETSGSVSGGSDNSKYFGSLLLKHDDGIAPRTFANKHGLRLSLDQNVGSKIILTLGGDILHNSNDRGLSNNENNGAPPQAAYSLMPSFLDFRGICPGGSRVTDPANPCGGVSWPSTAPYAFSNPFQTVALLLNKETVWREIMTGRLNYNLLTSTRHTVLFTANGGGDIFTQKNSVFSPPEMQFEQTRGIPGTSATGFGQSQSFNVNGNVVYTYNTRGGSSATTQAVSSTRPQISTETTVWLTTWSAVSSTCRAGPSSACNSIANERAGSGFSLQEEFLTLNDRLLLTVGGRADKSSNNSHAEKVYYYPKGSISYRVPISGLFSELKVRAAAGQSGNLPSYGSEVHRASPSERQWARDLVDRDHRRRYGPSSGAADGIRSLAWMPRYGMGARISRSPAIKSRSRTSCLRRRWFRQPDSRSSCTTDPRFGTGASKSLSACTRSRRNAFRGTPG